MKALLIIDVQNGMFLKGYEVFNGENLIHNIKTLISKARSTHTPIFYVQHNEGEGEPLETGTIGWEIHPEIAPEEGDVVIQKTTPDSFFKTPLDEELKKRGIEHLIITGIQTDLCVDTTCRRAVSEGYKITLVSDAHSTWPSEELTAQQIINHHNGTLRWFGNVLGTEGTGFSVPKKGLI
ncbi:cysteine hydrolase family protein [Bacillus carboniphilus]|uniref:Cysteine hydrolase family protein n=1 Tax=Bacillus carboniphilus TaxID=86663 RepID=A0ABP3GI58_9BACI